MKLYAWRATRCVATALKDIFYTCAFKFEDLESWAEDKCDQHV